MCALCVCTAHSNGNHCWLILWPSGQSPHRQQCAQLLNENKPANLINCEKRPPPPHVHTHTLKVISSQFFPPCLYVYSRFKIFFLSFHFLKRWQAINTNSDWNTQGLILILGTYDWEHTSTHMLQVTLPPHFSVTEASVSSALHLAFKKHWY